MKHLFVLLFSLCVLQAQSQTFVATLWLDNSESYAVPVFCAFNNDTVYGEKPVNSEFAFFETSVFVWENPALISVGYLDCDGAWKTAENQAGVDSSYHFASYCPIVDPVPAPEWAVSPTGFLYFPFIQGSVFVKVVEASTGKRRSHRYSQWDSGLYYVSAYHQGQLMGQYQIFKTQ